MTTTPVILLTNNAVTTLAAPITSGATTANLATGTGSLFPNPSVGQYFPLEFSDAATGLTREIVHVTARATDTITMVRAQEGTVGTAFTTGDNAVTTVTAATMESMSQVPAEQTAAAQSFVMTGGYQCFNNGFIVQWGIFHTTSGNGDTVSFPIAFPNSPMGVVVTEGNASGWTGTPQPTVFGTASRTTTQFALYGVRFTNSGTSSYSAGITALWLAWGN